jgi:hypothetical protein
MHDDHGPGPTSGRRARNFCDRRLWITDDDAMGLYASVRGWVDCFDGQEELVREIVDRYDDESYSRGWSILTGPNGDVCVVYCGTIREQSIDWLLEQVKAIATLPPPVDPEDRIRGLFLVHHQAHGVQEWQVRDGHLVVEPVQHRYDYLYA